MESSKKYRITLYCIVTGLFWFSFYSYVPTLSPYIESLGASYKMIGIILGSFGFTQMLLRIPLGIISDKINRRKVFVVLGVFLGFASALGMWLFNDLILILIFRAMSGAAAATWVTYVVLFSSYFDSNDTPKAMGIINAFLRVGQVTAMLIGGQAAQYYGQKAPFLVAVVGGIIGLVLSTGVVEKKNDHHKQVRLKSLILVMKEVELIKVSILAILFQIIIFATVFGFVPVAAKKIGATSLQLGMLTTLSTLPAIFSSALSGTLAERYGEKKTIMFGFLVIAFSCITVPYISSVLLLFIIQIIGGFARGFVFSLLMGLSIKNIEEDKRATAMGFYQAVYGIGMFLGPIIVGFLSDIGSLTLGFWFTGVIGLFAVVLTGIFLNAFKTVEIGL
ncbi:MFS transporter [Halothermothrix orenii]|uniref:Major facilitator superfamily MFS_1 n=1 Tax=Halothermothrix orenii (strain H 168 / OCM 544 / DSM 9562) TaxID=373903 RepID=B8CY87_HALOH|nr:MFS transporter [Halothermothrix orenii]ACL70256.1 major facilitator superfamily MFS_1 [Halothermothrix orenii H 168]